MAASPLNDLLLALFDSGAELRRFLVLAGLDQVEHRLSVTKGDSIRLTAAEATDTLGELDLVKAPLFEALAQRAPERASDIWGVARGYGIDSPAGTATTGAEDPTPMGFGAEPPAPLPSPDDGVSAHYADFVKELESDLAAADPADPAQDALAPERWPWTGAAAVLGSFRPG